MKYFNLPERKRVEISPAGFKRFVSLRFLLYRCCRMNSSRKDEVKEAKESPKGKAEVLLFFEAICHLLVIWIKA